MICGKKGAGSRQSCPKEGRQRDKTRKGGKNDRKDERDGGRNIAQLSRGHAGGQLALGFYEIAKCVLQQFNNGGINGQKC